MKTINEYRLNYESLDEKRVLADTMEAALRLALKEIEDEPKSITCVQKKVTIAAESSPATVYSEAVTETGETAVGVSVVPDVLSDVKRGDTVYFQYMIGEDVVKYTFDHWEVNGENAGSANTLRVEIDENTENYVISAVCVDHTAEIVAPKNVEATNKTSESITFAWEGELDEGSYYEYTLTLAETGDIVVNAEHTTLNSVEIEQLEPDESYKFSICIKDKYGNASEVVNLYAATQRARPLPVINLQAENITVDSADITFEAPTGVFTGYKYSIDDGNTWETATGSPISLTGLTDDTEYTAYVVTTNVGLDSAERSVTFTTLSS